MTLRPDRNKPHPASVQFCPEWTPFSFTGVAPSHGEGKLDRAWGYTSTMGLYIAIAVLVVVVRWLFW
ncbi:MAG: hypothetical protein AAF612_03255 [Planctomycetota bacterium]